MTRSSRCCGLTSSYGLVPHIGLSLYHLFALDRMAAIAVESADKYSFVRNEAKGSIQSRIGAIASSVCQTADNCDNSYCPRKIAMTMTMYP